jgi:U3 small nucleolar ribonucleoprotein protein IMP4
VFGIKSPNTYTFEKRCIGYSEKIRMGRQRARLAVEIGTEIGGDGGSHEDDEYRWAGVEDPKK